MSKQTLTVVLDAIGRTIIGEILQDKSNDSILAIQNPALLHIQPNPQTGQIHLQILPLFFKEFQADKEANPVWNFKRANVTETDDLLLDFKLITQYNQIFNPSPIVAPNGEPASAAPVIKLFDN